MSKVYDLWEKLVGPVLDREELRRLALCDSFSTENSSDFSSRFSFDSAAASSRRNNLSYPNARPMELKEIMKATENFQPAMFIGEGVMSQAFKAWIDELALTASKPGTGMAVTVKRWCNYLERHQEWWKKIDFLVQLRHPNLVDLVGYCTEEGNVMLVYEFMPNGSLGFHLFTTRYQSLPWTRRIKVALDVARGLCYLHDREIPIIHRDLKTANVLLDWELNAKLSNYCYGTDDPTGETTCISTRQVIDNPGYTAPEYKSKGHLTTKSNVYTFGVVLLELLSSTIASNLNLGISYFGKKSKLLQTIASNLNLGISYFGKKSKLLQIMDARLEGQYSRDAAYEVVKLELKCLNLDLKSRPRMADVVVVLQQILAS